jgi:transcription elongation factor GreA
MKKLFKLTAKGVDELKKEFELLVSERSTVSERIKLAREFGDLSENAEYSSARQDQERAESRISEIDHILKNVTIIKSPSGKNRVELGNTVVLSGNKVDKTFTVVGSVEADPLNGLISDESPIGKALLGKKLGDDVEIVLPSETVQYKISLIS